MHYTSTTLAVLGLATLGRSHMIMNTPVPYGKSTLNNSPLLADGSDFPCKQRTGVYDAEGASNSMALGSTQSLAFTGSATHGGGSCQVSITYDQAPTTSSTWKVIHSIEGGCPIKGVAGNNGDSASAVDPDTYSFTIPTSLPTGNATLAWTWFNKIGNREMYMNCAPVSLTASSSKRSDEDELMARNYTMLMERDTAAFNALPDMFVANINNGCGTQDSTDLLFPNPGDSVEQDGTATSTALATPTGTGCGKAVSGGASATAGATSAAASVATSAAVVASSSPAATGGVFATVASSAGASMATSAPVASSTPVASAVSSARASTPVASSSTAASTGSTGTTGTGSAIAAGTTCTTEGEWNCISGTSYQQCASGTWSVVMKLAAGTSCTAGESTNINITASRKGKRSIRFSGSHLRRHLQKS
ncbi:hypothetical protein BDZ45DRAFT_306588 [Acephala macrosclerotiorum]|nr:hypothetical protein BDZ45DRAFT_306588 [Acephala macrosclerotiorum]